MKLPSLRGSIILQSILSNQDYGESNNIIMYNTYQYKQTNSYDIFLFSWFSASFAFFHWSPTVPVSVWLPEPARDRGSKQETLNNDFYHTTSRSAAIFGVQGGRSYLVLALTLWIGLCPMKRSSGVWNFGDVSVTYRRSFGNHTLAGPYVPVTYYRNRL